MLSRSQIKHLSSLKEKKARDSFGEYVVEGSRSAVEFLAYPRLIKSMYALPSWIEENKKQLEQVNDIYEVSEEELKRISSLKTPNRVVLIAQKPDPVQEIDFTNIIIVLDDIRDPGNLGTIIRIADWFGIGQIICSPDTVDPFNAKAVQASMGSICRVQIKETALEYFFKQVPSNINVYGTFMDAPAVNSLKLDNRAIIVIGNEARGISQNLSHYITQKIAIPAFEHINADGGTVDSLNAAIATSIICFEFRRQRNTNISKS